jgi:parvulin-like peptidyl-prolyl isomerase
MNRVVSALICVFLVGGCGGLRGNRPANPAAASQPASQHKAATTRAADTRPSSAGDSLSLAAGSPRGRPADTQTSTYDGYTLVAPPQVVEALVLTVNDGVITVNDVLRPLRAKLEKIGKNGDENAFRAAAEPLISEEMRRQVGQLLLFNQANRELSDDEKGQVEKQVEARVKEITLESGGSKAKLDEELRKEGTSLEETRKALQRAFTGRYYLQKSFMPDLASSRADLWRYYQEHKDEFSEPRKVKMQVLWVPFGAFYPAMSELPTLAEHEAAKQAAKKKAQEARAQVLAGDDFAKVVAETVDGRKDYRAEQGGVWDYLSPGSFRERRVEDAAFAGQVGQVSEVIEGETGDFIVKTLDFKPGTVVSFEQAQKEIDRKLREQRYEKLSGEHFLQLQKKATIQRTEAFQKFLLDRAVNVYLVKNK